MPERIEGAASAAEPRRIPDAAQAQIDRMISRMIASTYHGDNWHADFRDDILAIVGVALAGQQGEGRTDEVPPLVGERRWRPDGEREPINVDHDVIGAMRHLLFAPEMRGVGYSEFIYRTVALAWRDIRQLRGASGALPRESAKAPTSDSRAASSGEPVIARRSRSEGAS